MITVATTHTAAQIALLASMFLLQSIFNRHEPTVSGDAEIRLRRVKLYTPHEALGVVLDRPHVGAERAVDGAAPAAGVAEAGGHGRSSQ
jgi:hypothetical protein